MNSPGIATSVREQLKLFLMELRDKTISFTISGFLKLELPTFVSFLKGVFTNLLILLQFSNPGDSYE
ncbi:uncharacterized protein Gr58b [Bemisia tabaci]|uniref:uncharacterized protein Gr58b n=1 Tax=Bemisia tabaci TaxID=7038 RepID=UPI003B27FC19